jgi:glutathione S-transferase
MTLIFHTLSGSPFGWKVQLALEHKQIAYDLKVLSAEAGELKSTEFLALNPHGKLPVIVYDSFVLYESEPIVEYLEDNYPNSGSSLWPQDIKHRAVARRIAKEAESYVYSPVRVLVTQWLNHREGPLDLETINHAKHAIAKELDWLEGFFLNGFVASTFPGAADYALYPLIALLKRIDIKRSGQNLSALIPAKLQSWSHRVEELPYFAKTYPSHWKA